MAPESLGMLILSFFFLWFFFHANAVTSQRWPNKSGGVKSRDGFFADCQVCDGVRGGCGAAGWRDERGVGAGWTETLGAHGENLSELQVK